MAVVCRRSSRTSMSAESGTIAPRGLAADRPLMTPSGGRPRQPGTSSGDQVPTSAARVDSHRTCVNRPLRRSPSVRPRVIAVVRLKGRLVSSFSAGCVPAASGALVMPQHPESDAGDPAVSTGSGPRTNWVGKWGEAGDWGRGDELGWEMGREAGTGAAAYELGWEMGGGGGRAAAANWGGKWGGGQPKPGLTPSRDVRRDGGDMTTTSQHLPA